jgi:hypothetical protein
MVSSVIERDRAAVQQLIPTGQEEQEVSLSVLNREGSHFGKP